MEIHYALMKAHSMLSRRISSRAQKELGLTSGQPKVLDCLLQHEGSDQKTLAAVCEIEQATLGTILLRMEKSGLIQRKQRAGNRRSLFVYLTDQGRKTAMDMQKIFTEEDQAALHSLSDAERETLTALLQRVCGNIAGESEESTDE